MLRTWLNEKIGIPFKGIRDLEKWIKKNKDDILEIKKYDKKSLDIILKNGNTLEVRG